MSRRTLEQLKTDCKPIAQLLAILDTLNEKIKNHQTKESSTELAKRVEGVSEYQYRQRSVLRNPANDRAVPIETIDREQFRLKYGAHLSNVTLHYGEYSDELTRTMNLLALTIGTDIYFRNGAYKPETEEGRALLAHEMTHVAQYSEKRIKTADRQELEEEAEQKEKQELYDPETYITVNYHNRKIRLTKRQYEKLLEKTAEEVDRWVEMQKYIMDEQKYLHLLCNYQDFLSKRENLLNFFSHK